MLGVILLVALTICSRNFSSMGGPSFLIPLALPALRISWPFVSSSARQDFRSRVIVIGLVLAASVACSVSSDAAGSG